MSSESGRSEIRTAAPSLPEPPLAEGLEPLIHLWPGGDPLLRCHDSRFGATEFNPGLGAGRFHPLANAAGESIPTLYGSATFQGALSETVFHDVPFRGANRRLRQAGLLPLVVSTLAAGRDLRLAQLHGHGLRRLQVSRGELIEVEAADDPRTRRWAEALHRCGARPDGLVWVSRLHDTSLAVVLFGDRVAREELEVVEAPLPLAWGPGLEKVRQAAEAADILLTI